MKQAKIINKLVKDARNGGWALTKLNFVLAFGIPFNRPHGFKIKEIGDDFVSTIAPYKRKNFNHIRGIHACGIATISEFATGLLMMNILDPSEYRVIMSEMKMEYHYQAKMALTATAHMTKENLQEQVITPLESQKAVLITVTAITKDEKDNHVATASITWQIKRWADVKTKL